MLALNHRRRVVSIPLTPLIDVVFILLLFFMLSSSFQRMQQMELGSRAQGSSQIEKAPVQVVLRTDGAFLVDGYVLQQDSRVFQGRLADWVEQGKTVHITAQPMVEIQSLVRALDLFKSSGVQSLNLTPTD